MYKTIFNKRARILFKHFSNKRYALFSVLGKEVLIGTLSVATLAHAKAAGISIDENRADSTLLNHGKEVKLDEVLITASRAPLTTGQQARMVAVLNREDIHAIAAQSVNDLLKYAVGIDVRQRGAIGAQTDISVRGGNYEQVAILLNGIHIGDPQTGHNAFDFPVDVSQIERIEILSGPSGRVYGTSSLLGAINIITKLPTHSNASAFVKGGSYGFLSGGAAANWAQGLWNNGVSDSYTRSDGYARSAQGRLNMDFEAAKAFYQGGYDGEDVRVNWHAGVSSRGFGSNQFYGASDDQYEHTFKTYTAIQAETKRGVFRFRPAVYWNRNMDRYEWHRGKTAPVPFNYARTDVYGLNMNGYFDWAAGRTAMAAEFRNEDLVSTTLGEQLDKPQHVHGTERDYTRGLNRTNLSFVLEHNLVWRRLSLSAGVIATKNSWAQMNMRLYPGVDLAYKVGANWKVYASYNSSLRMPSATELYYKYKGFEPDKHLKPEELSAFEMGVKHLSPAVKAHASVYFNRLRNLIDWVGSDDGSGTLVWKSVNFGKINSFGVETAIDLQLDRLFASQHFFKSVGLSYAYIHQNTQEHAGLQSRYALEYLRHKLSAKLLLNPYKLLNASVMYRFCDRMGSFAVSPSVSQNYKPYGVLDARLSWDAPRYSVLVEVNNVLNRTYFDFGKVPQPGFWLMAGASVNINL